MAKRWTVGLIAVAAAGAALLAGCQGVEVQYNQRIVVQLKETTGENPIDVTVKVDGKEIFGPGPLVAGDTKNIPVHEPTLDNGPKLTPGVHTISWTLHRNGMPGKVGSVDMTIFSGTNTVIKSASTKYIMPPFALYGQVDIKVTQPATSGGPAKKP